jgi:site-specific DNA recombinase
VVEEYRRRLDALSCGPRRHELDVMARRGDKLRHALGRLIDGYAEGLIDKHEFEPRIAEMRRRIARLDAEMAALRHAEEQTRSLQLVIGKLSAFAEMVRERLETADWSLRRDIVRTLVKRIEVTEDVVRVVFRVEPGSSEPPTTLPHCQTGGHPPSHAARRQRVPLVGAGGPGGMSAR